MRKENLQSVLDRADHGTFIESATHELEKVVKAVRETQGKGNVKITIEVMPIKGKQDALEVKVALDSKIPRPGSASDLYFSNEDGTVSRKHPGQPDLPGTDRQEQSGLAPDETIDEDGVVTKLRK